MKYAPLLLIVLISCAAQSGTQAQESQIIPLLDSEVFNLSASPSIGLFDGRELSYFAYNNQVPGPLFKVKQGSEVIINFTNNLAQETLIHWHGVRVDNKYDGMHLVQHPIAPSETFEYHLKFPDDGIYWYHPHVNEPEQQERGLYGTILVEPSNPYPQVDHEEVLILDDIRLFNDDIEPFEEYTTYALMGRFGTDMFINGKPTQDYSFETGTTARFFIVNTANTRMFNFSIRGAKMKVIGGDSGRYAQEFFADSIILAPSERAIIDVAFENAGTYQMLNINPHKTYKLGAIVVEGETKDLPEFAQLNEGALLPNLSKYESQEPDHELIIKATISGMNHNMGQSEPIEWEDTMPPMNAQSTNQNTKWILRDAKTGKENMDFTLNTVKAEMLKIRLTNPSSGMHAMQHPIHIHGQRFIVLGEKNPVWKDTVLVPAGKSVDIVVDFSNPGDWMLHCHISEHLEAGMSIGVHVAEEEE